MSVFARTRSVPAEMACLLVFLLLSAVAAGIGSLFTMPAIPTWYSQLVRPALAPPNWVFGPVWTILYTLMAVAAWLVWRERSRQAVTVPLTLYGIQLALSTLWSYLFFGLRSPGLALSEIALLWVAILATLFSFFRVNRVAGWLLVPYLLWVSFAVYLNLGFWRLNP